MLLSGGDRVTEVSLYFYVTPQFHFVPDPIADKDWGANAGVEPFPVTSIALQVASVKGNLLV